MIGSDDAPETRTQPTAIGSTVARPNRYLLYSKVGTGGMASVYAGCQVGEEGFERLVAIKRIHAHLARDPKFRNMFLDEARVAATLQHPNLVQVTDFGLDGDKPYLVMEYVNGEPLSAVMHVCHRSSRKVPFVIGARIMAWACEGLHAAHETRDLSGRPMGLVHRDVSPHNIVVSYDGVVKVTDFGIAMAARRVTSTDSGQVKGKLAYMSPEQIQALPLDRRSDVFSLGIVLFETTLDRRLFKHANDFETMQDLIAGNVPRPSSIDPSYPEPLERIVLRALAPLKEDRFQTARDMQRELERYLVQAGVSVGTSEVSEFMHDLFAERIERKTEVLSLAAKGEPTTALATVELTGSQTVTRPTATSARESQTQTTPASSHGEGPQAPGRRRTGLLLTALACVVAVGVGVLAASWLVGGADGGPAPRPIAARPDALSHAAFGAHAPSPASPGPDSGPAAAAANDADASLLPDAPDAGRDGAVPRPPIEQSTEAAVHTKKAATGPRRFPKNATGFGKATKRGPVKAQEQGWLNIMAHPWCEVYLDGRYLGRTPLVRVPAPAGRRVLKLLPQGLLPEHRRVVEVRPGAETPVSFRAPAHSDAERPAGVGVDPAPVSSPP